MISTRTGFFFHHGGTDLQAPVAVVSAFWGMEGSTLQQQRQRPAEARYDDVCADNFFGRKAEQGKPSIDATNINNNNSSSSNSNNNYNSNKTLA